MIRRFFIASLFLLLIFETSYSQTTSNCFEIQGILADACGPTEQDNEIVFMRIGPTALNTSNFSATWSSNAWLGLSPVNATTTNIVANINATITSCGRVLQPTAGVLPAGSRVLLVTSTLFSTTLTDFTTLSDTVYMIFQNSGNSSGHFKNGNNGTVTLRTTTLSFSSPAGCSETVTYDAGQLVNSVGNLYSSGGDGASIHFSPTGVPSYFNNGCKPPIITPTIDAGTATAICANQTINLTGIATGDYKSVKWTCGSGTFSSTNTLATTYTPAITASGAITIKLTLYYDCRLDSISDIVTFTINPLPNANITASGPTTFCTGSSVTLTASGGGTYLWSPGGQTTSTKTITTAGTYTVTVTNACGNDTAIRIVTANPLPTASITPSGPTTFCSGGSVMLTASGGTSYSWSPGGQTTAAINVSTAGTYTVTSSNSCGTATASQIVNTNPLPTATITLGGPTTFCIGGSVTLTASGGTSYSWSPGGQTTAAITVSTAGTYTVTSNNSCGTATTSQIVTVNPLPTATITPGGPTTFCIGGSVTLTASGGTSYSWSPGGQTTATITVSTAGTYTVTSTNSCGTATTSQIVTVNPLPTATITPSGPTTFCIGGSVTLTASGGTSYSWSPGGQTTAAITVSTAGTYTVTSTNSCGTATSSQIVTVNPLPTATITPSGPTTFCIGDSVTLTASGGNSYSWSLGGQTTAAITVSTAGTYTVTSSNGCGNATASQSITINPLPTAAINPSGPTTFCSGGSVTLTASGGTSYSWSPGGQTTAAINVSTAGTYTVTSANSCGTATTSQIVTVNPLPTATITPSGPTTFCIGGSVTLTASGGTTYSWNPGGQTTSAITVSTAGTYTVTSTNSCGTATTSQTVTVNPLPTAAITPSGPTTFCTGSSVSLTASGGTSYLWSTGDTIATIIVSTVGTYTVTSSNGCGNATASQPITINPLPTSVINSSGPTAFCIGDSVTLTASGGASYSWSLGGQTTAAITVSTAGTYTVISTNSCGTATTSQIVTINPLPTATITPSGPTTFCIGSSVSLTASGGTSYLWSTGDTITTITVSIAGTYTVTSLNGCGNATASQSITINPLPTATITPSGPTTFCSGGSVTLTALGGTSYSWSPGGQTTAAINVSTAGTYTVTSSNSCGTATASQTITITTIPTASISASGPLTFCQGDSVTLTATGGTTNNWSNGDTSQIITVNTSGTYSVTTNSSCGAASDSVIVIVNPSPTAVIAASGPTTFCSGGSVTLTASGGNSYLWSTGDTSAGVNITTAGTYSVTTSNSCGNATQSQNVSVNPLPTATINSNGPTTFCLGNSVTLTASGGTNYLWSPGGQTTATIAVNGSGIYTVTSSNSCGNATQSQSITVNSAPTASIIANGPTTFCTGSSVTLTASGGNSYLWNTGDTSTSIVVTTSGSYSVSSANGCGNATQSQTVIVNSLPTATIIANGPTNFCSGNSVTLVASGGNSYLWNTGDTTAAITITTPGTYSVTSSNGCGNATASQIVVINNLPAATILASGPTTLCAGGSVTLTASGGSFYSWSNGSTNASITVNSSGTYTVTSSNICGTATASQSVTVNPLPIASIVANGPTTFCRGSSVILNAGGGNSFVWNTGETTPSILANTNENYTVYVSNSCGTDSASINISVQNPPVVSISISDTTICKGQSIIISSSNIFNNVWNTGDTSQVITINTNGIYSVTQTNICGSDTATAVIHVVDINAAFTPSATEGFAPLLVYFENKSTNADFYSWSFGDGNYSTVENPSNTYDELGVYTIVLIAQNSYGCIDSVKFDFVNVNDIYSVYIPNTFTPNGDNINGTFKAVGHNIKQLNLKIFDRWGLKLFETNDKNEGWDGTYKGYLSPTDVYVYELDVVFKNETREKRIGQVNLIK